MSRMTNAHRTCDLILGVGDGKVSSYELCGISDVNTCEQIDSFRGVEYSKSVANFFTPENLQPEADWHPRIPGVVYWGKTHYL